MLPINQVPVGEDTNQGVVHALTRSDPAALNAAAISQANVNKL